MTEAEWLAAEEPQAMLTFLYHHVLAIEGEAESEDPAVWWVSRKLRLWAVSCCRRIEALITDPRSRTGLEAIERYCDGELSSEELRVAVNAAAQVTWDYEEANRPVAEQRAASAVYTSMDDIQDEFTDTIEAALGATGAFTTACEEANTPGMYSEWRAIDERAQAELVREVFGNPFRPVVLDPAWLTSDVRALAHAIYAERAWDRMPILADALQEAGCESEDVLAHCRSATAPHVRGCWVIDLLLGKAGPR